MKLSAAVLAGGSSSRMGRDKAFLVLDGRPLVMRIAERLHRCADEVFVVSKDARPFEESGLRVVTDNIEAKTPLAGIATALHTAEHDLVFVCACDMPFLSADVVKLVASRCDGYDVAVPRNGGRAECLHAVWSRRADVLRNGESAVHRTLERLRVAWIEEEEWREVDPEGLSFMNINTPADHSEAAARMAAASSSRSAPRPTAIPSS